MKTLTINNIIFTLLSAAQIGCADLGSFFQANESGEVAVVTLNAPFINKSLMPFKRCAEIDSYIVDRETGRQAEFDKHREVMHITTTDSNVFEAMPELSADSSSGATPEITNNQVKGVDEPDIVKVSEKFIFAVRGSTVEVLNRSSYEKVQTISLSSYSNLKLLTTQNTLVVISNSNLAQPYQAGDDPQPLSPSFVASSSLYYNDGHQALSAAFYDIGDKGLTKVSEKNVKGTMVGARLNNGRLIMVSKKSINFYHDGNDGIKLTDEKENVNLRDRQSLYGVPCDDIIPPPVDDFDYSLTSVHSISMDSPSKDQKSLALLGGNDIIYVTSKNIYLVKKNYNWFSWDSRPAVQSLRDSTIVRKVEFSADNGDIQYTGVGSVIGKPKDQFALQELQNGEFLSIVTTTSPQNIGMIEMASTDEVMTVSSNAPAIRTVRMNHLHVLDTSGASKTLGIVGFVRGIAPTEDVKSVRYIKDMAYIVTFRQTDPLFAIQLSNPKSPVLLGELKIPGFSSYMHPMGEDRMVGVGSAATESGRVLGVQVSLFDISNPSNMLALEQGQYGERGSATEVSTDHHAFYMDQQRKRIAVPMRLTDSNYSMVFNGAYIFNLKNDKLEVEAKISHADMLAATCYVSSRYLSVPIRRVFELDGALVSLSDRGIKAYDVDDLSHVLVKEEFEKSPACEDQEPRPTPDPQPLQEPQFEEL